MDDHQQRGVTLIELLTALSLLVILLTAGVPALNHLRAREHLRDSAERLAADLRQLRNQAISRASSQALYLHFRPGKAWCFGASTQARCDCRLQQIGQAAACTLPTQGAPQLHIYPRRHDPGIELLSARFLRGTSTRFDALRGLALAGTLTLQNPDRQQIEIKLSALGRVRLCTPRQARISGYPLC